MFVKKFNFSLPSEVLRASKTTGELLAKDYDAYGDSYTQSVDAATLKTLLMETDAKAFQSSERDIVDTVHELKTNPDIDYPYAALLNTVVYIDRFVVTNKHTLSQQITQICNHWRRQHCNRIASTRSERIARHNTRRPPVDTH